MIEYPNEDDDMRRCGYVSAPGVTRRLPPRRGMRNATQWVSTAAIIVGATLFALLFVFIARADVIRSL